MFNQIPQISFSLLLTLEYNSPDSKSPGSFHINRKIIYKDTFLRDQTIP